LFQKERVTHTKAQDKVRPPQGCHKTITTSKAEAKEEDRNITRKYQTKQDKTRYDKSGNTSNTSKQHKNITRKPRKETKTNHFLGQ
jgi:hypothetical protein